MEKKYNEKEHFMMTRGGSVRKNIWPRRRRKMGKYEEEDLTRMRKV